MNALLLSRDNHADGADVSTLSFLLDLCVRDVYTFIAMRT